ncbi:MAG: hypothetical protein RLZZ15_4036 [Verrucomicrobiota bacterium]
MHPADRFQNFDPVTAHLRSLIDELASRAEDFSADPPDRAQTKSALAEELTLDYPTLPAADRAAVVAGVMAALAEADFFGVEFVGDPFADEAEGAEADEE